MNPAASSRPCRDSAASCRAATHPSVLPSRVLTSPAHPYTRGLVGALPSRLSSGESLAAIPGTVPGNLRDLTGCAFASRCPLADDRCRREEPRPRTAGDGHEVSCHRWEDVPHPATELFLERSV